MKKITLIFGVVALSLTMISCDGSKKAFDDTKNLMQEQIVALSSAGSLEELMEMQVQNGDTIVEIMSVIEPQLSDEQIIELQILNQLYNKRLRQVTDSLVQINVVDSITIMQ